jgi:hypothetical protein
MPSSPAAMRVERIELVEQRLASASIASISLSIGDVLALLSAAAHDDRSLSKVAPGDPRHARRVRMVLRIVIRRS